MRAALVLILLSCCSAVFAAQTEVHVSPAGNDAADGTREAPVATLTRARDLARAAKPEPARRIVVHGGTFFDVHLELDAKDSGLTIEAAPGEKPVLLGGVPLRNWEKDGEQFYSAALPELPGRAWEIRMLQVDGKLCSRARLPAQGTFAHLTTFDVPWMSSTGNGWKRKPTQAELTTLKYKAGDLPATLEIKNAEITVFHMWDDSCVGVAANDTEKQVLTLTPPTGHPPGAFGVKKYVVWNTREGLTAPGQWFHDRVRNRVVYWPLPGQEMQRAEVIAPTQINVVQIFGSSKEPAKNVSLRGLTVAVATVPLVTAGFAAAKFEGAITLRHTEDATLADLRVQNVAGHGINVNPGKGTRVSYCEVTGCGAGGVYVGGSKTVISDNHIHGVGLFYPAAIGIFRRSGNECLVSHNEVHDCSYSAINFGGESNIIEDNHIYDCMKTLHDGAAIYSFGAKNCILRRNFAHDIVDTGGYGASSYYLDEQSEGCIVEQNLSVRVARPSHNHMARNNTLRNNIFMIEGDAKLTFPKSSGFTVERNVIYASGKIVFEGSSAVAIWSKNVLFSGVNKIETIALKEYGRTGQAGGAPPETILADPLFMNREGGDFRFKPESPALKAGFEAVDFSTAGPRRR